MILNDVLLGHTDIELVCFLFINTLQKVKTLPVIGFEMRDAERAYFQLYHEILKMLFLQIKLYAKAFTGTFSNVHLLKFLQAIGCLY